jgi:hypothetical protein
MSTSSGTTPFGWIDGHGAKRPMLPSEHRVTVDGTRRLLPWARADHGAPRPLLPWEHRLGNDWRGVRA